MKKLINYEFFKLKKKTLFMILFFIFIFWSVAIPILTKMDTETHFKDEGINYTNEDVQHETVRQLVNYDSHYSMLSSLTLIILSSTIICEEFGKGTIKLLYIRPYKRVKHYFSKFIVVFACMMMFSTIYLFETYITSAVLFKENINLLLPMAETMTVSIIAMIPTILIYESIFFINSYLVTNTPIAIVVNFVAWYAINMFGIVYKGFPILSYTFIRFWNFPRFIFGDLNNDTDNPILKSLIICILYFIALLLLGVKIQKKKDIKNET